MRELSTKRSTEPQELGLRWRKKQRQHNDIVDVTVEMVRTTGYDGTTVEEIARRLEISTATFYNYFRSKDEVLACWVQAVWDQTTDEVIAGQASGSSFRTVARRLLRKKADVLEKDKSLWRVIATTNTWSPHDHKALRSTEERSEQAIDTWIRQAQSNGELKEEIASWRLGQQLDGMLVLACANWALDRPRPHSLRRSLSHTLDLFLGGAAATTATLDAATKETT